MKNAKSGGKGKPQSGIAELSKMQKELNDNMQKAKEEMNQQGLQQGSKQMSRQFSEMAKQQEMIRRGLQDINQKFNKDGNSKLGNLEKIIQEMEQTETDLVNKKITQESLLRQTEIQSRLLDAEKAERERELDQQKESKSGKNFAPNYNLMLKEFIKSKEKEVEMQKTVSPLLNDFYKSKISEYFKKINTGE
jgi:parvulin-like peptidyl-prolyl isomerase